MKKIIVFPLLFLALTGCQDDDTNHNSPVTIEFENVRKSFFSGAFYGNEGGNHVINSETEWADFYKIYTDGGYADSSVDFEKSTAIITVDELHPDLGHSINITKVVKRHDSIFVSFEKIGKQDEVALPMMEQPYHFIKIPKTKLPIAFIEQ